jgi:sensor histidine kinase YesM
VKANEPGSPRLMSGLTLRRVAGAMGTAGAIALVLNPIFEIPFVLLLGRTLFVGLVILVAFTAAGNLRQKLVPRAGLQVAAVVLGALLATFVVYTISVWGDFSFFMQSESHQSGFVLIAGTSIFASVIVMVTYFKRERDAHMRAELLRLELERSTLEKQALNAQLRALQAQIEPHFLFNTLANVQELVEAGSPLAPKALKNLIGYLRAALPRFRDELSTLSQEAELSRAYLEVMAIRMGDRLRFSLEIAPDVASMSFLPMTLLTLVENAIKHGIDPAESGGEIAIRAAREGDQVRVSVADTGAGLAVTGRPSEGGGTGLRNLRERLSTQYGKNARLEMTENAPHGVVATIIIET